MLILFINFHKITYLFKTYEKNWYKDQVYRKTFWLLCHRLLSLFETIMSQKLFFDI